MKILKNKNFKFWLKLILSWRLGLFIVQIISGWFLDFNFSFPYVAEKLKPAGQELFWQWANFDGVHYLTIAQEGYLKTAFIQAFFPLYPWLMSLFTGTLASGLLLSHLFLGLSLWLFYRLLRLDLRASVVKQALWFLILFPTSFYLVTVYNESLFLFLSLASFYLMRKQKWLLAGLLAGLASATRITGLFLAPALIYEWFIAQKSKSPKYYILYTKYLKPAFSVLFSVSGALIYSLYLNFHFNDPFLYVHVQGIYGAQRSEGKLVLLYQVFWRYLKMLATVQKNSWVYFTVCLEFLAAAGFLGLLLYAFKKKVRLSYLIYALPAFLLPTLTGTFSSMPRYVLVLFPAFMVLGQIKSKWLTRLLMFLSTCLLVLSVGLFTHGYWIS